MPDKYYTKNGYMIHKDYPKEKFPEFAPADARKICENIEFCARCGVPGWMVNTYWGLQQIGDQKELQERCGNRVMFCKLHKLTGQARISLPSYSHQLIDHIETYKTEDTGIFVLIVSPYLRLSVDLLREGARIGLAHTAPMYYHHATSWYAKGSKKMLVDVCGSVHPKNLQL